MIRYGYFRGFTPPAPFVYVTLQNPFTGAREGNAPAQLDTAADRTLLPETLVRKLGLPVVDSLRIGGVGGIEQDMPLHPVLLGVHDLPFLRVRVVSSPGESWVLLGRDVLNEYRMLLDGPGLGVDVG